MYFLINHDTGVVETAENLSKATTLMQEWVNSGTSEQDISLYFGVRKYFDTKIIKQIVIKT